LAVRRRLRPAAIGLAALAAGCASASPAPDAVLQHALERAPSGEAMTWPAHGATAAGAVTPLRTFRAAAGYCRDYEVGPAGGAPPVARGTACRDGDGVWRTVVAGAEP
jgi:surface antigen